MGILAQEGDGPIEIAVGLGWWIYVGPNNSRVLVRNTNNGQVTRQALSWALISALNYMKESAYGEATFTIYDGGKEVGEGSILI